MTDQTESEYAELLADLDFYEEDNWRNFMRQYPDAQAVIRNAAAAIRALEVKVREYQGKAIAYDLDALGIQQREAEAVELVELRADRDRLAGEMERLERNLTDVSGLHVLAMDRRNQAIARLTSELAAAREALQWIADNSGRDTWLSQFERRFDHGDVDDLMAAIDAARRAGEGEG